MNKRKSENGITLTILAITIAVLMVLMGVVILTFEDTDIIGHTEESVNTFYYDKQLASNEVDQMALNADKQYSKLSQTQVDLIRNKIKTGGLYTVNYEPQTVDTTVTISGNYNGGLATQTFNQTDTGAIGSNKLNWYVLSANVNEVNLVSSVSKKQIILKDSGGYNNGLYFFNQIAQNLFLNEKFGVTANKAHVFRLTDIKKAVEQINGNGYDWYNTFLKNGARDSSTFNNLIECTETKKYPQLYGTSTGAVIIDNNIYEEEDPEGVNIPISGDLIASTSKMASQLKYRDTEIAYRNKYNSMITNLGKFGSTDIAEELFNTSGNPYWLASRVIDGYSNNGYYGFLQVRSGCIDAYDVLCSTNGNAYEKTYYFRIVISIPASHISISNDGIVSLKE